MNPEQSTRYEHALVVLRRDLRLHDNTALLAACGNSRKITVCFILDPVQLADHDWHSRPSLSFMIESLLALHQQLISRGSGLLILQGSPAEEISAVLQVHHFDAVYFNRDYTPFALQRDQAIARVCDSKGVPLHVSDDALLIRPEDVRTGAGGFYRQFTAFYKAAIKFPVALARSFEADHQLMAMDERQCVISKQRLRAIQVADLPVPAGRAGGEALLHHLDQLGRYAEQRDFPALDATSHLSVHLKFGTLSVREVYQALLFSLGQDHALLRQLYWRDFFSYIGFHFPHVFGAAFDLRLDAMPWNEDESAFEMWCKGETGFPIVDAGMRELASTGLMHNRVRMITASFLVKDLHIDWRLGEAWFARHLVDYDPAINNGNWQWVASTGCDNQPWFRIFNPWLQQKRFDPDCTYIKRWIPELRDISARDIHRWESRQVIDNYPAPMLDHATQAKRAKMMFRNVLSSSEESAC